MDLPGSKYVAGFVAEHDEAALLSRTRILEVSNHEQPTKDSHRDRSFAGDRRENLKGFVERGFNVVANSRKVTQSTEVAASDRVALVDGHIGEPATAAKIVETALSRFQSIDALVNNAGIFFTKPFTSYTAEDFKALVSTNVEGFLYVTQLAIKQMLVQKTGGTIVTITAALASSSTPLQR
jgi:NAD(P)-dependent dehydrogenase (short-subunit alcohol dehydrogenase family)